MWPRKSLPDARFFGLYAYGGFVTDAVLKGGEVGYVRILSTAGGVLRFENPWPGGACVNGKEYSGHIVCVDTAPGEEIRITKSVS